MRARRPRLTFLDGLVFALCLAGLGRFASSTLAFEAWVQGLVAVAKPTARLLAWLWQPG